MMHKAQLKKQYGIRVISATEPVSDDEGGEIYEMFLEWNDEKYSQRLSKRVRDAITTCVGNGTYTGGSSVLYGYRLIDTDKMGKKGKPIHRVAIDEEKAEVVRFFFEEYAKGTSKKKIAEMINAKGYRYKGQQFMGRSFDNWMGNMKYTGEFLLGGRVCNNMYPQIIDKALFLKVQERCKVNKYFSGSNTAKESYLLTSKAFCGHCGELVVSGGGTSHTGLVYRYYDCKQMKKRLCDKKREHKGALELYVIQCVKDFLSDPKNVELAADDIIAYYEQRTGDDGLKGIELRIARAKTEMDEIATAFIEAKSSSMRAIIERRMVDCEILLKDLTSQKAQLELERGLKITKQDIIAFVTELIQGDPNDSEYRRRIIDNLVFMVYVYDDSVVVYLNINGGKEIECITLDETNKTVSADLSAGTNGSMIGVFGEPQR
jgi:hypothetical protein